MLQMLFPEMEVVREPRLNIEITRVQNQYKSYKRLKDSAHHYLKSYDKRMYENSS